MYKYYSKNVSDLPFSQRKGLLAWRGERLLPLSNIETQWGGQYVSIVKQVIEKKDCRFGGLVSKLQENEL